MTDPHREKHTTIRTPDDVMRGARRELKRVGWTVSEAVVAALRWIATDPAEALAALGRYRVERRAGRPKGSAKPAAGDDLARERFDEAP